MFLPRPPEDYPMPSAGRHARLVATVDMLNPGVRVAWRCNVTDYSVESFFHYGEATPNDPQAEAQAWARAMALHMRGPHEALLVLYHAGVSTPALVRESLHTIATTVGARLRARGPRISGMLAASRGDDVGEILRSHARHEERALEDAQRQVNGPLGHWAEIRANAMLHPFAPYIREDWLGLDMAQDPPALLTTGAEVRARQQLFNEQIAEIRLEFDDQLDRINTSQIFGYAAPRRDDARQFGPLSIDAAAGEFLRIALPTIRSRGDFAAAKQRAKDTLIASLNPAQRRQFRRYGSFDVSVTHPGKSGTYRVLQTSAYGVEHLESRLRYCVTLEDRSCPLYDQMLATKLLLEIEPARFFATANVTDSPLIQEFRDGTVVQIRP